MVAWHYKFFLQSQLKAGTGCPVIQEALRAASKARSKKSSKVFILSQHRSRAFVQHFPFFCQPASFHSPPFVFASALFLSPRFVKGSRIMRSVWRSVSRNLWGKSVHSVAGSTVFFSRKETIQRLWKILLWSPKIRFAYSSSAPLLIRKTRFGKNFFSSSDFHKCNTMKYKTLVDGNGEIPGNVAMQVTPYGGQLCNQYICSQLQLQIQ